MLKTSRKGAGVGDVLPWGHLLTAGTSEGQAEGKEKGGEGENSGRAG